MELKHVVLTPELYDYLIAHGTPPDPVLTEIEERTKEFGRYQIMQTVPEQGALLHMLTKLIGARKAIEIGTFTGYSSVCIARALPKDGQLLCCDVSEEWTRVARDAWEKAGVTDRVELVIGPALDTLRSLPQESDVDLAFLDADKVNYWAYFEELLLRVRPNGLIIVDNTLFQGEVVNPDTEHESARLVDAFNERLAADDRVEVVMLPIHDGITLVRKLS
ncbi:O-methyltransferase [Streptomyces sp. NPDC001852]|uniref:O-methyltransferase n=1 Tax=Streptomyces sp. NPDC001852 TaxID=3364619 RepID=UPI00369C076A